MKGNTYDAITEYLPTEGWLGAYLDFTNELEACPRFRFFTAACVMGAAINNKVWIQRGDEGLLDRLMPNPWVTLLAPPYRGHKSSTINMAVNCLTEAFEDVRILADKLTPEAVVHALASPMTPREMIRIGPRDATGLIKAPEMSVLFGKQQYNTGMVSLITDLYDFRKEWRSETIGRGKEVLRNNCISIIAGSTPKWLQSMIPQDAFTGGFMRRFIIVEMPSTFNRRVAEPSRPSDAAWDSIVERFRAFHNLEGQMGWTDEGRNYYRRYYEMYTPTNDEQYDAYMEAEVEQALKIAMLLELNKHNMRLSKQSIEQARNILKAILPETRSRIRSLTTHPRMHLIQEIKELLHTFGELSEGDLLSKVYRSLSQGERQYYEALSIMKKSGEIEVAPKGDGSDEATKGFVFKLSFRGKGKKDDLLGKCEIKTDEALQTPATGGRGEDGVDTEGSPLSSEQARTIERKTNSQAD